jgi:membrane protease subunit HflK
VIDAFREVQAAEQERDRLERQADAYANRVVAEARGEAAQIREEAEGYRARRSTRRLVKAARFTSRFRTEYAPGPRGHPQASLPRDHGKGPWRRRQDDPGRSDLGRAGGGSGVVPYLPLNELRSGSASEAERCVNDLSPAHPS